MNKNAFTPVKCNQGLLFSKAKNFTGFTLIELLIVIGIIAILASAVIVAINPGQQFAAARDATRERHIKSLQNSLTSYQISNQGWGDLEITDELTEICNTNEVDPGDCDDLADISDLVDDEHINQLPVDPEAEGDGTGYYIAEGSVILIAGNRETRFIGVGAKEDEIEFENNVPSFPFSSCGDTFTDDRDGEAYATVEIGDQCWFAEDLRYDDGCSSNTWDDSEPYDACDAQGDGYDGLLYQWGAAMDGSTEEGAQGICPDGWHVPTHDEFTDLERQVCSDAGNSDCETEFPYDTSTTGWRGTDEGAKLKDPGADWCAGHHSESCGESGFLALPGGLRNTSGSPGGVGSDGHWWSSTEDGSEAWLRYLRNVHSGVSRNTHDKAYGRSVRCLRD